MRIVLRPWSKEDADQMLVLFCYNRVRMYLKQEGVVVILCVC